MWMEIAAGRLLQVVCAAALMAAGVNAHEIRPQSDPLQPELTARPKLATIKRAPPIVLHDPQGRNVRLEDLHGRVILVSFIYTTCTTACPLLTERMAQLRDRLRSTASGGASSISCPLPSIRIAIRPSTCGITRNFSETGTTPGASYAMSRNGCVPS